MHGQVFLTYARGNELEVVVNPRRLRQLRIVEMADSVALVTGPGVLSGARLAQDERNQRRRPGRHARAASAPATRVRRAVSGVVDSAPEEIRSFPDVPARRPAHAENVLVSAMVASGRGRMHGG